MFDIHRDVKCSICAELLSLDKRPTHTCEACQTPYHEECWQYSGGCSRFGCAGEVLRIGDDSTAPAAGEATRACPFCAETIKKAARLCRFCMIDLSTGRPYSPDTFVPSHAPAHVPQIVVRASSLPAARDRVFSPPVAGFLCLLFPGLGQLYKGQLMGSLFWFFAVFIGYDVSFVMGFVFHVWCVINATTAEA